MEISFDSINLRDTCQNQRIAEKEYGPDVAHEIEKRVADILASECYSDLPLGNPRIINIMKKDFLVLDLKDGYYFLMNNPSMEDGKLDMTHTYRVKLIKIGNKNDSI